MIHHLKTVPGGVSKRLAALQFGGTTAITQSSTGKFAGVQIPPVVVHHWGFIFLKFRIIFVTKQLYDAETKSNHSCLNNKEYSYYPCVTFKGKSIKIIVLSWGEKMLKL
jgi:hypothetical protein